MSDPTPDDQMERAEAISNLFGAQPMPAHPADVDPERMARVTARLRGASGADLSPRRQNLKDLADSVRDLIACLVATDAPDDVVAAATADIRATTARFDGYRAAAYGFAEAANAGQVPEPIFDQSPLIGIANPLSPPMTLHQEGDTVIGRAVFGQAYEGPPSCVHGGYIAAAFDEVLGATQSLSGAPGMTGTLSIRYESPTPLFAEIRFACRIDRIDGRKIFVVGESYVGETLTARATGIFISMQPGTFLQLLGERQAKADEQR